jgi:hypothetical protein
VVHVLFFAVDMIFNVGLNLVLNFYHLFDCRGSFDHENVIERGAMGVAGFAGNHCLDLALKILLASVEKGDKALLGIVDYLIQVGNLDVALLDFCIHSSKVVLAFGDGIVNSLVVLWCQDCRRNCVGRPFCNGFLSFNGNGLFDVVDGIFSDVSNLYFRFKWCIFNECIGKLLHVAAFLVHGETVFVKGGIKASPIFVHVGAERLPVVVGLCFADAFRIPKTFSLSVARL